VKLEKFLSSPSFFFEEDLEQLLFKLSIFREIFVEEVLTNSTQPLAGRSPLAQKLHIKVPVRSGAIQAPM
jgi:hypothetical protein